MTETLLLLFLLGVITSIYTTYNLTGILIKQRILMHLQKEANDYQKLSQIYKKLGNEELASTYRKESATVVAVIVSLDTKGILK